MCANGVVKIQSCRKARGLWQLFGKFSVGIENAKRKQLKSNEKLKTCSGERNETIFCERLRHLIRHLLRPIQSFSNHIQILSYPNQIRFKPLFKSTSNQPSDPSSDPSVIWSPYSNHIQILFNSYSKPIQILCQFFSNSFQIFSNLIIRSKSYPNPIQIRFKSHSKLIQIPFEYKIRILSG